MPEGQVTHGSGDLDQSKTINSQFDRKTSPVPQPPNHPFNEQPAITNQTADVNQNSEASSHACNACLQPAALFPCIDCNDAFCAKCFMSSHQHQLFNVPQVIPIGAVIKRLKIEGQEVKESAACYHHLIKQADNVFSDGEQACKSVVQHYKDMQPSLKFVKKTEFENAVAKMRKQKEVMRQASKDMVAVLRKYGK
ncbi:hypothetical protein QR680_004072 [Steinernema hermaphroditum]|uniref:B box-type domain-containing protein n=1 Tax=Steinernema hermaphroditum TaxID=289476 RepID=A0AA39LSM6_9BILA|nr:hypothetical protein QR680_004072 [Steinernema hermaphroditum]